VVIEDEAFNKCAFPDAEKCRAEGMEDTELHYLVDEHDAEMETGSRGLVKSNYRK